MLIVMLHALRNCFCSGAIRKGAWILRKFKHVIIFGVDGGGHFFREADTPGFDRIFENGAVTYGAITSFPSISAECWSSMMTGVSPALHGRTNSILGHELYPDDSPFPTLYKRIREVYPDAEIGAFCEWTPLIKGLVEEGLNVEKLSMHDENLMEPIHDYIINKKPDFLFIHSDSVDHAGHSMGYGTEGHLSQISVVDGYIARVYDTVREAGMADDCLFMVVCDHGGTCDPRPEGGFGGVHGGWSVNEREITIGITGKGIAKGTIPEMNIRDIAAIVLWAFGIKAPAFDLNGWTSQIPAGVLVQEEVPAYRDISCEKNAAPRISVQQHGTALI